jgi:hypothetical protein
MDPLLRSADLFAPVVSRLDIGISTRRVFGHIRCRATKGLLVGSMIRLGWLNVSAVAQTQKPNILVIWGHDIGTWNISHNNRGMMGAS